MKILVITRNAWDDTNAIGNTLSNFFRGLENIEFASIYFRSVKPNNDMCFRYFRTSELDIARKWFNPAQIGAKYCLLKSEPHNTEARESLREKKIVRLVQKYGIKIAYTLSDYLWYSNKWINENLCEYVESFAPDMMFTFVKSAPQYYLTVKLLREKYNIPLFSWIADDEYTGLLKRMKKKEIHNLQYILNESSVVRGCSEELCAYYNSIFNCDSKPLYKSCDLSVPILEKNDATITMVYAGNLLYGRLDIIVEIARTIEDLNKNGANVFLEIYSNTVLLPSEEEYSFKKYSSVKYMGKKEYDYIKKRLSEAHIVLHVESFEENQIIKTKYSFSTKIIDCLQCGSVILGVGPKEVSSMRYIEKVPGSFVINDLSNLSSALESILINANTFKDRAMEIRRYAEENHSVLTAKSNMINILNETTKKRGV